MDDLRGKRHQLPDAPPPPNEPPPPELRELLELLELYECELLEPPELEPVL